MPKKVDSLSVKRIKKVAPANQAEPTITSIPEEELTSTETLPDTETKEVDTFEKLFPEPTVSITHPPLWIIILIVLIVASAVGTYFYAKANPSLNSWLSLHPFPSSSPTATPTTTPEPTVEPTEAPTPEVTPEPTPAVLENVTSKESITIRVLNGTTAAGAAATAQTTLEKAGFTIRTIGNAKQRTYSSSVIYFQSGKQKEAELVQASLSTYSTTLQESSLADPDMILVVIGAK